MKLKYIAVAIATLTGMSIAQANTTSMHQAQSVKHSQNSSVSAQQLDESSRNDYSDFPHGLYGQIDGGYSHEMTHAKNGEDWTNKHFNNERAFGDVKIGMQFNNGIRSDLSYTKYGDATHDLNASNVNHQSAGAGDFRTLHYKVRSDVLMANVYYNFIELGDFQPYVMAGAGVANNKLIADAHAGNLPAAGSESKRSFAWQAGVGTSYAFTDNLFGDVGVKYTDRGTLKYNRDLSPVTGGNHKLVLTSIDTSIGIRYMF